jgi:hypothetical protein
VMNGRQHPFPRIHNLFLSRCAPHSFRATRGIS